MTILEKPIETIGEADKRQEAAFFSPLGSFEQQLLEESETYRYEWQACMEGPSALIFQNTSIVSSERRENDPQYELVFDSSHHKKGKFAWQLKTISENKNSLWQLEIDQGAITAKVYEMDTQGKVVSASLVEHQALTKYMWSFMSGLINRHEAVAWRNETRDGLAANGFMNQVVRRLVIKDPYQTITNANQLSL